MIKKFLLFFFASMLLLFVGCAPTMEDFVKLNATATSQDEIQRIKAVKEIGEIKDADPILVVPALADILKSDNSSKVRKQAASSLTRLGFLESEDAFTQSLRSDEDAEVRLMCAEGICTLLGENAQEQMIQFAEKDNAGIVRASCVKCLGKMTSNEAKDTVRNLLQKDEDRIVRVSAARALGEMRDQSGLIFLIHASRNDSALEVKEAAVVAIGAIPGQESMDFLTKALKDSTFVDSAITAIHNNDRGNESPETINIIISYVDQKPDAMDNRVCDIFLHNGKPQVKQSFRNYYSTPYADNNIIKKSAQGMRDNGDTSLVASLIQDLNNSSSFKVQVNLVRALAYFRDRSAAPTLLNMLRNRSNYHSCLSEHLIWALSDGGLNDARAYDYLCSMCCNESDKRLRHEACVASSAIHRNNYKLKLVECPCWNK